MNTIRIPLKLSRIQQLKEYYDWVEKNPTELNLTDYWEEHSNKIALEFSKDSGGNMARIILFWPAWAQSLHNADEAILAANDRKHYLIKTMKKINCKDADMFEAKIKDTNSTSSQNNIAEQLKILKELYDSGDLTKEEYTKAKEKVIN